MNKRIEKSKAKILPRKYIPPKKDKKTESNEKTEEINRILALLDLDKDNDEIKSNEKDVLQIDNNNLKNQDKKIIFSEKEKKESIRTGVEVNSNSSLDSLDDFDNILSNSNLKKEEKKEESNPNKNIKNDTNQINSSKDKIIKNIPEDIELIENFIIKDIIGDGNCFYRSLCYFYRENQDEYNEFRELIVKYIDNNPDEYLEGVADEDIDILENDDEITILNKKREYIKRYAEIALKDGEFAGDFEITTACTLFDCNIKLYILTNDGYKLYYRYNPLLLENIQTINILFINNNHFNLLIPNELNRDENRKLIDKNINIKELEKIVLEDKNKHKKKINLKFEKKLKSNKYVKYPKIGFEDYYNEIYRYLNNAGKMPKRLNYDKSKNRKTQEKKRNKFRKLINAKYKLVNDRLQYLYKFNNKEIWVNIIYEEEKLSLLNYIHYSNNHMKRESMDLKLLDMGYYWYGYSNDITKFIDECGICHTEKIKEKLP